MPALTYHTKLIALPSVGRFFVVIKYSLHAKVVKCSLQAPRRSYLGLFSAG